METKIESFIKPNTINKTHTLKENINKLQEFLLSIESIKEDDKCILIYNILKNINIEVFKINVILNNKRPSNENTIDFHTFDGLVENNNIKNTYIFKILLDKVSDVYMNDYTDTFNEIINIFSKFKIQKGKDETDKPSSLNLILLTSMRNKFINDIIEFDPIFDIDEMDVEYIKVMDLIIDQFYNNKKREEDDLFQKFKREIIYHIFELIRYLQVNEQVINKIVNEWKCTGMPHSRSDMY